MSTRGAHSCVRKTPTGLPDWTSSVSSSSSVAQLATIASKASQLRAALPGAAVDDELVGALGDLGVEVVHQHPQRGFLGPALAGELAATRSVDDAGPARCAHRGEHQAALPAGVVSCGFGRSTDLGRLTTSARCNT